MGFLQGLSKVFHGVSYFLLKVFNDVSRMFSIFSQTSREAIATKNEH